MTGPGLPARPLEAAAFVRSDRDLTHIGPLRKGAELALAVLAPYGPASRFRKSRPSESAGSPSHTIAVREGVLLSGAGVLIW